MKKILVCFLVLLCGMFALSFSIGTIYFNKEQDEVVETIANLEPVEAAVANTTEVQTRLKKWGYYTGAVDGINGPKTIAAVKAFQKKYGLTQDGIVGSKTCNKLNATLPAKYEIFLREKLRVSAKFRIIRKYIFFMKISFPK